jgi:hypothetical protein
VKGHEVFEVTQACDVPKHSKILSAPWVLKNETNGRCYSTIRIVLTLIVMAGLWAEIVDVKGAFLPAEFEPHHQMYITVPKGFEKYYPGNVVLLLKRTLYGTCQAVIQFWKKLCGVMKLINVGHLLYLSWVDDILIANKAIFEIRCVVCGVECALSSAAWKYSRYSIVDPQFAQLPVRLYVWF